MMVIGVQNFTATTHGIIISVTPSFVLDKSTFSDCLFFWEYRVKIENISTRTVQLISRYWKIINQHGIIQEVDGYGVVGKQPVIEPNKEFSYSSGAMLSSPSGMMHGHYVMRVFPINKRIIVEIPLFSLDSPYAIVEDN